MVVDILDIYKITASKRYLATKIWCFSLRPVSALRRKRRRKTRRRRRMLQRIQAVKVRWWWCSSIPSRLIRDNMMWMQSHLISQRSLKMRSKTDTCTCQGRLDRTRWITLMTMKSRLRGRRRRMRNCLVTSRRRETVLWPEEALIMSLLWEIL